MAKKKAARKQKKATAPRTRSAKKAAKKRPAKKKAATKKAATKKKATRKKATRKKTTRKKTTRKKATRRSQSDAAAPADLQPTAADRFDKDREQYADHKERTGGDQRRKSRNAREIQPALEAARKTINKRRREKCRCDFKLFCETYFPEFFYYGWSPAHLRVAERIETSVLKGGLFAVAMPRGSGKTTLSIIAVVWSIIYSHRRSVVLFGATKEAAVELMTIIKAILEAEDFPELAQDFPEVAIPCAELEDKGIMTKAQRFDGKLTRMKWEEDRVILPRIPDSESSAACIRTRGLDGHLRGLIHRDGGKIVRPDFVILDDPSSDKTATSDTEIRKRYKTIDKGIRGLAGPGKRIAGIMPCTVIEPDDLADRILSGAPGWATERIPMIAEFDGIPDSSAARWLELREIYMQEMDCPEYPQTNAYYKRHRKELDAGLSHKHYWPDRIEEGFVSAIQHAMCWYMTRPESFWSEAQQQPRGEDDPNADLLSVEEIQEKQHNAAQNVIPKDADVLVSFIDVQHSILFYVVMAFNRSNFTGYVIDYGAWPQQQTRNFHMSQAKPKLADKYRGRNRAKLGLENMIRKGLTDLELHLFSKRYVREDGIALPMSMNAVDCSDGELSIHLREVIAELWAEYASLKGRIFAAFGRDQEMSGKPQPGDRTGDHWRARNDDKVKTIRKITYQPNHWKSFGHARFATDIDEPGSASLFRDEGYRHKTFSEHMRCQHRKVKEVRTREGEETIHEWRNPPGGQDHWFDCFTGCHVLAAHEGADLWSRPSKKPKKARKSLAARQAERLAQGRA